MAAHHMRGHRPALQCAHAPIAARPADRGLHGLLGHRPRRIHLHPLLRHSRRRFAPRRRAGAWGDRCEMFKEMTELNPKPAFVLATGDICEIGSDDQYESYQEVIKSLGDVPLHVAPGNHDVRWNPRGKEGFTRGTNQPLYQSWDQGNVHFVLLDSTVLLEHWGHISQDQLDWLAADLEKVGTNKPVIIGFHHWVGRNPVMVDNEQALFDLMKPYNVVLWLQGHGHANIDWSIDGVPATMVGALYDSTYHILRVRDDGTIEITQRQKKQGKRGEGGELVTSASQSDNSNAIFKPVMTIPLKRQPAPKWTAEVKHLDKTLHVTAQRGEL